MNEAFKKLSRPQYCRRGTLDQPLNSDTENLLNLGLESETRGVEAMIVYVA